MKTSRTAEEEDALQLLVIVNDEELKDNRDPSKDACHKKNRPYLLNELDAVKPPKSKNKRPVLYKTGPKIQEWQRQSTNGQQMVHLMYLV